jgi:hypothetical protein
MLLLFSFTIIAITAILFYKRFNANIAFDSGYIQGNPNPIYFSGNRQQKRKKHNMLRISKMRKK